MLDQERGDGVREAEEAAEEDAHGAEPDQRGGTATPAPIGRHAVREERPDRLPTLLSASILGHDKPEQQRLLVDAQLTGRQLELRSREPASRLGAPALRAWCEADTALSKASGDPREHEVLEGGKGARVSFACSRVRGTHARHLPRRKVVGEPRQYVERLWRRAFAPLRAGARGGGWAPLPLRVRVRAAVRPS